MTVIGLIEQLGLLRDDVLSGEVDAAAEARSAGQGRGQGMVGRATAVARARS